MAFLHPPLPLTAPPALSPVFPPHLGLGQLWGRHNLSQDDLQLFVGAITACFKELPVRGETCGGLDMFG